jgi:hypothetical protein
VTIAKRCFVAESVAVGAGTGSCTIASCVGTSLNGASSSKYANGVVDSGGGGSLVLVA